MTRRQLLQAAALGPLAVAPVPAEPKFPRHPNVVFVLSDDQGFGDLSCHGNVVLQTPNLDRIAREGAEFEQFHVNPVCSPTRSSLLTGRYYYRTGVVDTYLGRSMMYNDEVTVAEVLKKAGYKTGIFGKWHLGDHYPLRPMEQGFDECLVHGGGGIAQPSDPPDGNSYFNPKLIHNGRPTQATGYCTDVFFNAAMEYIEANQDRSFFTYIAVNAPHSPLQIDERYIAPYRGKVDETTARTYGMIANLDENIGRLLRKLEALDLGDNTILIFMTDNGPTPQRFNSGMRGTKGTVYEGGLRVPFFIRWPKEVRPETKIGALSAHIDFFPTLLDLCGVPQPKAVKIDGSSLAAFVRNPEARVNWPDRTIYFQWHRGERAELYNNCAAISPEYKLVNGKELYHLKTDPAEARDVSASHAELVANMRAGYEAWFRDVSSTRNFEPPRIFLGSKFENPVLLTRQDWRGPRATWDRDGLGFWEVDVQASGSYRCTLQFPPATEEGIASVMLGTAKGRAKFAKGDTKAAVTLDQVVKGVGRLEAVLAFAEKSEGPFYVEVRQLT